MNNSIQLLKTRRFLPLFITQSLAAFNDNVFKNAMVILITYQLASLFGENSQILITLAAGLFILPFFLFSATAGQLADKYKKSQLVVIIKVIEIVLMLAATVGFLTQNVTLLMMVLFALGMHATFFGPLKYALLPEQLHNNELIAGNGLIEAGTFISILVGTIIGSTCILLPIGEYIVCGLMIGMAVLGWISSLFIPRSTLHTPQLKINYNVISETYKLIAYSKQQSDIFLSILGISWFWLVGATFLAEFPAFVKDELHASVYVVTLFLTIFSIGLATGSLLCNRLLKGKIHANHVPLGALGMAIFTFDFYFSAQQIAALHALSDPTLMTFLENGYNWRIMFDLLLIAICGGIYTVPLYAILQHRSDEHHRARVIASNNVMNALFMVIAAAFTILMLKLGLSIAHVFLLIAIGNTMVAIYICKLLPDLFFKTFFKTLLKTLYRVKINGIDNFEKAGNRVVIIANHTSFLDAMLLAAFLPDKLTFAINTTTSKRWWVKLFLNLVDAYPLDPTNPMAIKSLIEYVRQDKKCVIFPEGRITMTGALMKIYEGPGLITDKSTAKLLPIRIEGAQFTPFSRLKGKLRTRLFPTITITIFPPQSISMDPQLKGKARRQAIGHQLYGVMREMMFISSPYQQTLASSLIDAMRTHGRRHIVLEDIERQPVSYHTFLTRAFIVGDIIQQTTHAGEYVGILLPNAISNALTFFALQLYSRVPAMLNYTVGSRNVVTACQTAQIKLIYSSHKFVRLAKLEPMIEQLTQHGIRIVYLEDLRESVTFIQKIKGAVMAWFPTFAYQLVNRPHAHATRDANATAVLLFTSGSEGTPKGVVLSHRNIQANRYQLSASVDFTATDKIFNALPVFHSFGLTGGLLLPLLSGVKTFLYPSPLHYRIVPELAYDTNATILFGTDTFLAGYAKYAHPYDFYSIRYVFAGAEKLREETRQQWAHKFGVRIFEGYGATETAPVIATNTPMQHRVGTVGQLLPGIEYQLQPVPGIAQGGALIVKGPNVMQGYLLANQPGVIIPIKNGWYETGDIVSLDAQGFITILGRIKRFAKIAGEMVSLTMVEEQINLLWPTFQHAVVSMPDARKGEQLILVTTFADAKRDAITAYMKAHHVSELAIPKRIMVVSKMPLLGTGKIDYVTLKEYVVSQQA